MKLESKQVCFEFIKLHLFKKGLTLNNFVYSTGEGSGGGDFLMLPNGQPPSKKNLNLK